MSVAGIFLTAVDTTSPASATRCLKHVPSGKIVRPQSVDQQGRSQRNGSLSTPASSGDGCQPQGSCQISQWLHGEKQQAIQTFMIYLINQHNQNTFILTRCLKIISETFHILQTLRAASWCGDGAARRSQLLGITMSVHWHRLHWPVSS